jgi:type IV pilus assembly protein PilQ
MKPSQSLALAVCLGILLMSAWPGNAAAATEQNGDEALSVGVEEVGPDGGVAQDSPSAAEVQAQEKDAPAAAPVQTAKPAVRPPKKPVRAAEPRGARLTGVRVEAGAGRPVVRLVTTAAVASTLSTLTHPDRLLLKLADTLLTWKPTILEVNRPPLNRIRAAQHGQEVWVVLDLDAPTQWIRSSAAAGLTLVPAAGLLAPARNSRPAPATAPSKFEAPELQTAAGASYQVVDVSVEDLGEKTRVIVTTNGPVRYRVQRERRGDEIELLIYGAGLSWSKSATGLSQGAVSRIGVQQQRLEGEPVVDLLVKMTRPTSYSVLKEQNQIVLELDNPTQIMEAAPTRGDLRARLSVDFQSAELVSVLRALAQDVGFDLVLTPGAQEMSAPSSLVTVAINEQPLENVLDLILRPRRLAYEVSGNTLRVGLAAEFPTETRVFSLKNIDSKRSNLKDSLEGAFTEGSKSRVILDEYSNRVIVTAIPSDLRRAEAILNRMDVQPRLLSRSYPLSYAEPNKLAGLLRPMLSSQGRLEVNERDNALVITDIPGSVQRLAALVRSLDTRAKQVMIEAWIVEISLSDEQSLGISWNLASRDHDPTYSANVAAGGFAPKGQLTVGTLQTNATLSATLSALEAKGVLNTLSNPRIATLDNQSATLSASQNIPYPVSLVSNGVIRSSVDYLELPITLTVTPHITQHNQVLLNPATLTVTTVVGQGTPPETTTRSAATQMTVADGEIIAIGGMIRDSERTRESKVPLLGDIPLLGYLFKSTTVTKDKVELVVFLTPHILD